MTKETVCGYFGNDLGIINDAANIKDLERLSAIFGFLWVQPTN